MCDKTCIFFFFPIINKYFLMVKRSLLSRCPSYLIFHTEVVEKIKTPISCSVTFLGKSCLLRDNVKKYDRAGQATEGSVIWRMCISCWITNDTSTHLEHTYITYCLSTATTVTRTRLSVKLDLYCLSYDLFSAAQEIGIFCEVSISKYKNKKKPCYNIYHSGMRLSILHCSSFESSRK